VCPLDQQQRDVVLRVVADEADDFAGEAFQEGGQVAGSLQAGASDEGKELAGCVACLAEPVGVEEDRLTGSQRDGERSAFGGPGKAQPERRAAMCRSQEFRPVRAEPQRLGMATVDHFHLAGVRAHFRQYGRDELLIPKLAFQSGVDPRCDPA